MAIIGEKLVQLPQAHIFLGMAADTNQALAKYMNFSSQFNHHSLKTVKKQQEKVL